MILHKVFKILVALISLVGIAFLGFIVATGNDKIEAAALEGNTMLVDLFAIVSYVVLTLILLFVVFFVIKNLVTNTAGLKNTLIGVGAFAVILIISYLASGNDSIKYILKDEIYASDSQSKMVGAGLVAFYILLVVAAITMIFSGLKKVINK